MIRLLLLFLIRFFLSARRGAPGLAAGLRQAQGADTHADHGHGPWPTHTDTRLTP